MGYSMTSNKSIVAYLTKRYLRFDKEQPFIFLSALLAFLGIALGVAVLMIAMAIMQGTQKEFEKKLFTMNYPLTILPKYKHNLDENLLHSLEKKFTTWQFSPYVSAQVIVKAGTEMQGGLLFGVDFGKEIKVNDVLKTALKDKTLNRYDVIVGARLKEMLDHQSDKLTYMFTKVEANGMALTPRMKRFKVKGTFSSGLQAYDKAYHYTTLESVRKIMRLDKTTYDGIHIQTPDAMNDIELLKKELGSRFRVVGWWEQNGNFFSAMELEKRALFIVLMLIILIASVNIVSSLLMTVMNRRSDIALLLSLGATTKEISKIFLLLGMVISVGAIIVGIAIGFGGIYILETFDIISLPADVYGSSKLPLDLLASDFIMIVIGAFIISIAASFYPAYKASKVDLLQVLRNE